MNKCGYEIVKEISKYFEWSSVLDIGSKIYDVRYDFRKILKTDDYTGIDFQTGNGVDIVKNIHRFVPNRKYDTILSTSMLEHDENPNKTLSTIKMCTTVESKIIFLAPFYMHIHGYPNDYQRYTPEGMRVLLESKFSNVQTFGVGPERIPHTVVGLVNIKIPDTTIKYVNKKWKHDNGNVYYYAKEFIPPKIIRLIKYLMYGRFY